MSGVAKLLGPMLPKQSGRSRLRRQDLVVVPVPLFPSKLRQRATTSPSCLPGPLWPKCNGRVQIGGLVWSPQSCAAVATREASLHSTRPAATGTQGCLCGGSEFHSARLRGASYRRHLYTGATARECSRALRRAGASKVWVATLAARRRHASRCGTTLGRSLRKDSIETARMGRRVQRS